MPRKSRKNVGLIGLGIIGSRVAAALRSGGWHVYVWNRTPRAAPNFLASPAEVAELCDIVQLFVADAQALFDVLDAMAEKLTPQHVIVCNATVGPEATLEAAKLVEDRGAKFLDAPFTGSKGAAENRQLVYYIGGEDEVYRRAEPVLKSSSKAVVRLGKVGQAATLKVVTNMLGAVTVQVLAEALAVVQSAGIPPGLLADALEHHSARSGLADMKLEKMLSRDYEPHFSMKHMFKDVQLGIHIANAVDIDLPTTTATAGVMYGALTRGWSDLDYAALAKIYEPEEEPANPEPAQAEAEAEAQSAPVSAKASESVAAQKPDEPIKHAGPADEPAKEVIAPAKESLSAMTPAPLPPQAAEAKSEKKALPNEAGASDAAHAAAATAAGVAVSDILQKSGQPGESAPSEASGAAAQKPAESPSTQARPPETKPATSSTHGDLNAPGAASGAAAPADAAAKPESATVQTPDKLSEETPRENKTGGTSEAPSKPPINRIRRWFGTGAR